MKGILKSRGSEFIPGAEIPFPQRLADFVHPVHVEFAQDVAGVRFDRAQGHPRRLGDLIMGQPLVDGQLQHALLYRISPQLAAIGRASGGTVGAVKPTMSRRLKRAAAKALGQFPAVKKRVKQAVGKTSYYSPQAPLLTCLNGQLAASTALGQMVDTTLLRDVLAHPERHTQAELQLLLTLTTTVMRAAGESDGLEPYAQTALI